MSLFALGCGDDEAGDDDDDIAPDAAASDAPHGECAPVPTFTDDLRLDDGAAAAMPGDVYRLAAVGAGVIACGDDYAGAVSLDVPCRAIASNGTDRVVVGTRDGELLLLSFDGENLAQLDALPGAALRYYDLLIDGDRLLAAAGGEGILELSIAGDALAAIGPFGATDDARGLALPDDLLVADGGSGLRLLDRDTGAEIDHLPLLGVSSRVVNDGPRALVMRGAHGFDVVDVGAAGIGEPASMTTLGAAIDGAIDGDDVFVAEGSTIGRYRAAAGASIEPIATEDRPAAGAMTAPWFRALALAGGRVHVGLGDRVVPLAIGDGVATPELTVSFTTTFLSADAGGFDTTVVVAGNTGGAELVLLGADTAAPFGAVIPLQGAIDPRPNCPGQWLVAPDTLFQIEVDFRPDTADTVARALTIRSNDPDEPALDVTLEGNRPAPAPGAASDDFALITVDNERYQLSDHLGQVVFLKLFNFG